MGAMLSFRETTVNDWAVGTVKGTYHDYPFGELAHRADFVEVGHPVLMRTSLDTPRRLPV
jgi:hypothetical protein